MYTGIQAAIRALPVTANDFVFAWRLGCEINEEYNYMFSTDVGCVKNADAVIAGDADPSELGITAEDDKTLVVELEAPVSFSPA